MKKKIIISLSILLTLVIASLTCFAVTSFNAPKHPSEFNIGIPYEQALISDKPMVTVFYVDWCGYCLKFMPKFNIYSKLYKDKFNFVMVNVEANAETKKLADEVGLGGFPTVYIMDPKYDNRVLISNAFYQDISKFRKELDRYLRIRTLLDKGSEK